MSLSLLSVLLMLRSTHLVRATPIEHTEETKCSEWRALHSLAASLGGISVPPLPEACKLNVRPINAADCETHVLVDDDEVDDVDVRISLMRLVSLAHLRSLPSPLLALALASPRLRPRLSSPSPSP